MEKNERGNQSAVARRLGISRAAVSKQVKNRERTGFPEPGEDSLYDLDATAKWYRDDFAQKSGPTRGIRAEEVAAES